MVHDDRAQHLLDHLKSGRVRREIATAEVPEDRQFTPSAEHQALLRLSELSEEQRQCIRFRFLEDMSVPETAELMDRHVGSIKSLQYRAVRRLAQLLPADLNDS